MDMDRPFLIASEIAAWLEGKIPASAARGRIPRYYPSTPTMTLGGDRFPSSHPTAAHAETFTARAHVAQAAMPSKPQRPSEWKLHAEIHAPAEPSRAARGLQTPFLGNTSVRVRSAAASLRGFINSNSTRGDRRPPVTATPDNNTPRTAPRSNNSTTQYPSTFHQPQPSPTQPPGPYQNQPSRTAL
ncbi:hypothetical protein V500_03789, partial [Pseudogymnoascus sp. VKM F-4518 (FW-2643)]